MKHLLPLLLLFPLNANSQTDTAKNSMSPKFVSAMEKQIAVLDTATLPSTYQQCYNGFERLGNAEKKEWLPSYYMSLCLIMESFTCDTKKVDDYCDQAWSMLDHADSLNPDKRWDTVNTEKSEIFILRSLCFSSRIRVNPMSRGSKDGPQSASLLDSAQKFNAENPRIYLLRGQGLFYTPKAFGGGKDKAKPILEDAQKKFGTFVPASSIHPKWGKKQADDMLAQCK
ncbi:MAG: hypothetical protein HY064_08925 [Bacteroidetes bacterium]|nr:hypothetical protein [Bacteroidota bacterium]